MPPSIQGEIRQGGDPSHQRDDGAIQSADYDPTILSPLTFFQGRLTESGSQGGAGGAKLFAPIVLGVIVLLVLITAGLFVPASSLG